MGLEKRCVCSKEKAHCYRSPQTKPITLVQEADVRNRWPVHVWVPLNISVLLHIDCRGGGRVFGWHVKMNLKNWRTGERAHLMKLERKFFFDEQADLGFQRAGELVGMRSSPNPYTEIFLHSFARFTWSHAHFFSRIVRADRFFPPQKVRVGGGSPIHPSKSFPVLVIGDLDKKKNCVKGPSIKGVHDFRPKIDPLPPLSAVFLFFFFFSL